MVGIAVGNEMGLGLGLCGSFPGEWFAEELVHRLCRALYMTDCLELLCFAVKKVSSIPTRPLTRFESLPLTV